MAALLGLVYAWPRRMQPHVHAPTSPPPAPIDLNTALETVLVKALDSQTAMFERMQKLNIENAQLALETLQRRRYSKGGTKRAYTARRKIGRFQRDCRLCQNPMIGDPSVAEIIEHSTHREPRNEPVNLSERDRPPPRVAVEERDGVIIGHVDERDVDRDAQGNEQVECGDCLQGIEHAHSKP